MTDGEISAKIKEIFDMRPFAIENRFKLRTPIYAETDAYGHMGRKPATVQKSFKDGSGKIKTMEVELFPWEKEDYTDQLKKAFGL